MDSLVGLALAFLLTFLLDTFIVRKLKKSAKRDEEYEPLKRDVS